MFEDKNQNGTQDGGELGLENVRVYSLPSYFANVTDSNGNYEVYAFDTGYVNVKLQLPNYSQQTFPSNQHSLYVSGVNDSISGKDFGVYFLPATYDVETYVSTSSAARPGFVTYAYITVHNNGTGKVKNVQGELAYDAKLTLAWVSQTYTAGANKISFTIDSLNPGQFEYITVSYNVAVGAGNIGYKLNYYSNASITETDIDLTNNADTTYRTITGSYDPNMKESTLGDGDILPSTKEMEYTIHFQNTGSDTAFTVVVVDSLDREIFDHTSVEMLSSSHPYTYTIDTAGVIKFTFSDILLVDSMTNEPKSHGFVRFKLKLKKGLTLGAEIKNKAEIYFDFNEAIVTNTATNTLSDKTGVEVFEKSSFILYPNPSSGTVYLNINSATSGASNLVVYDLLGQQVSIENVRLNEGQKQLTFFVGHLSNGMYLVQLNNTVLPLVVQK